MPARGPHDDFETAKNVITAAYATFNVDADLEATREKYISDELEYVTRHGTFHGPDRYVSDLAVQMKRWVLENEIQEIVDAGDGAVIVVTKFVRKDPESGETEWKAWPAAVMRILDGKMVFFEGYVDSRKAFADYDVERD